MQHLHAPTTPDEIRAHVDQLLKDKHRVFGDMVMTTPDPTGQTVTIPVPPPTPPAPTVQTFTAEDIERARQQEKDKLYETLESERQARLALEERMEAFTTDLTSRQQAEEAAKAAAAKAEEEKRLAELSYEEKLNEFRAETGTQLSALQQQLAERDALVAKEREFSELMQYRGQAIQAAADQILPELVDLVAGNTPAEIDASVSALAARSSSILQQMAAATQQARMGSKGVGVTAPPVGPMDNDSGYQTVSAADIAGMDMKTYAQNRPRLLGAASQQQRDRGMFG